MTYTDWPPGWTEQERALTVAEDIDGPSTVEGVALLAEVEVGVAEEVTVLTEADLEDA